LATSKESKGIMTDQLMLVTSPDDILITGVRILLVDLTSDQSSIISKALTDMSEIPTVIVYSWQQGDPEEWLFDKSLKSQLIVFNAESQEQSIIGYFAGKRNSVFFGDLKSLKHVNKFVVYDVVQCQEILLKVFEKHGKN